MKSIYENMDALDKKICRTLQHDLPATKQPFKTIAQKLKISEKKLMERIKHYQQNGAIKKLRALLRHQKAGFSANAMVVWKVPENRIEKMARICCNFRQISHCYQRITYPGWPYNFYTMVHGRSKDECMEVVRSITAKSKVKDHRLLYSQKEFKKTSPVYF